ncbi:MAG: hypothetical protein SNJ82_06410, partial [Gemmataceae bacterium]
ASSETSPEIAPVVVVPSPLGVRVDPNLFPASRPPSPDSTPAGAALVSTDGQPMPPRKKSRRRRRRGGGGASNGQHAAAALAGSSAAPSLPPASSAPVQELTVEVADAELQEEDENAPQVDLEPVHGLAGAEPSEPPLPVPVNQTEQSFAQGIFEEPNPVPAPQTAPEPLATPESEPSKPATKTKRTATRKKTTTNADSTTSAKPKRASTSRKKKSQKEEASQGSEDRS